jgi:hypothetical protein
MAVPPANAVSVGCWREPPLRLRALAKAGRMKQQGRYYLLLPESVAARRAGS